MTCVGCRAKISSLDEQFFLALGPICSGCCSLISDQLRDSYTRSLEAEGPIDPYSPETVFVEGNFNSD